MLVNLNFIHGLYKKILCRSVRSLADRRAPNLRSILNQVMFNRIKIFGELYPGEFTYFSFAIPSTTYKLSDDLEIRC